MAPSGGAWTVGDPVAQRRFIPIGAVQPELGGPALLEVTVAYETWGTPRYEDGVITNAVLIEHALTGDAHAAGSTEPGQPTPGWWDALIGAGRALDTDELFVICANVLGGCQGTTGPSSLAPDAAPYGSRFPRITVRDQVEVERRLLNALGVGELVSIIGGSMGGMRVLEWLVTSPDRVRSALVLATSATATADQIATQTSQIMAIHNDANWRNGDYHQADAPNDGLGLARRIAHLTYRTEAELDVRFGRDEQPGEEPFAAEALTRSYSGSRFAVQSYLDHQAAKLVQRFDAGSYVVLTDAMTTHDVGRGRGGTVAAFASVMTPVTVAGIDSDRLYPLRLQQELAEQLPNCSGFHVISSPYGHDGFLLEYEQVSPLVTKTLQQARPVESRGTRNGEHASKGA